MIHGLNDYYLQIRPEEHEVLGVGRVIHDLKDNYRQIRPEEHEVLGVGRVIHGLKDNHRQIRPLGIRGWQSDSWS